eukprot:1004634-Rhodomonas_salina.1
MSSYNWKNHPFEKLHETGHPTLPATLSSFVVWKDGVVLSTGAVGAKHIIALIKWVMARPELILMFADVGVEVDEAGNADYSSLCFNQAIVALAMLCGKKFGTLDTNTEKG